MKPLQIPPLLLHLLLVFVVTYLAREAYTAPLIPRGQIVSLIKAASSKTGSNSKVPVWILKDYDDPELLTDVDKKAFDNVLSGVTIGTRIFGGHHSRAMYYGSVHSHPGEVIIKVLHSVDDFAWGEVKALKVVGDFVASGMLLDTKLARSKLPVIIMKRKPGEILTHSTAYLSASASKKKSMKKKTINLMCNQVAKLATMQHILHDDNVPENVLVTMSGTSIKSIQLIDWGAPGVSSVNKDAKKSDVLSYCKKKWTPIWDENQ